MKKNMQVAMEVIDGWIFPLGPMMHETKALNIIIKTYKQGGLQCHFIPDKPYCHWVIMVHFAQPLSGLTDKASSFWCI